MNGTAPAVADSDSDSDGDVATLLAQQHAIALQTYLIMTHTIDPARTLRVIRHVCHRLGRCGDRVFGAIASETG